MKILEAIERTDGQLFSHCTDEEKVQWLSKLDQTVWQQVLKRPAESFPGYTADTDRNTELLVRPPYDTVYLRWLEAQLHYACGEYTRYNNAITLFNTEFSAFAAAHTRANMPTGGKRFVF